MADLELPEPIAPLAPFKNRMAILLGLSGFVMYRDYQLRLENFAVMRERAKPRPGEAGLMAVVEPRPLSVFAKGLEVGEGLPDCVGTSHGPPG